MLVNLSYNELLQIASAISMIENIYGNGNFYDLLGKVTDCMNYMDNAPLTDVYPDIKVVK